MIFKSTIAAAALAALAFTGTASFAQERPMALSSDVQLVKPIEEAGIVTGEQLVEPTGVVPGDVLVFTISYTNRGAETATDFELINPVHKDTIIVQESAVSTEVSVDGGQEYGFLADLSVADELGEQRPATNQDITHLRWVIAEVAPAEAGSVSFRAEVR
ncbi:MAG: hypothetical protein ABJM58_10350 [Alteripontixanthobacter sp.]